MFSASVYQIQLDNQVVREHFQWVKNFGGSQIAPQVASTSPRFLAPETRNTRNAGGGISGRPDVKCGAGPYIDSRAPAPVSSISSFYPSLLERFQIDEELRKNIETLVSVFGPGVASLDTPGLIESVVENIPRAISAGYDFHKDVVACVQQMTRYRRKQSLWSLQIIFDRDLPTWKTARLAKEAGGTSVTYPPPRAHRNAQKAVNDPLDHLLRGSRDRADDYARAQRLRQVLERIERGAGDVWDLNPYLRHHRYGDDLKQALDQRVIELKHEIAKLEGQPEG